MYNCAVSAIFCEERKLLLKVQIIDDYFGNLTATFAFRPDGYAVVHMKKCAEDFLEEYKGTFPAKLLKD